MAINPVVLEIIRGSLYSTIQEMELLMAFSRDPSLMQQDVTRGFMSVQACQLQAYKFLRVQYDDHRPCDGEGWHVVRSNNSRSLYCQYCQEHPHQGHGNAVVIPSAHDQERDGLMRCRERLGGLLKYYTCEAA